MQKYVQVTAEVDFYVHANNENRERELFSLKDTAKFRMTTIQ